MNMNIDNRIEQAMDLVKTHLMYAVREEVDRLRFHINDLERKVRLV
jgi:polyhydroxyalkanoate synthesis regulator phasin